MDVKSGTYNGKVHCDISVVIPTYNRERTIKRCIDSVVNQTYPAFEILVVDDGSTDQTIETIKKEYADSNVRVIKQNHKGAQAARNTGIKAAKGKYIAFLDSDDEWLPDKLKIQVEALQENESAVICGNGYIQMDWQNGIPSVYKKSEEVHNAKGRKRLTMNGRSGYVYKLILQDSFCNFESLLTSKKNLLKIGLLDENVPSFQEWDTAIKLAQTNKVVFIQKPLFVYHLHDGETISKNVKKDIDGREYICKKYQYEILRELGVRGLTRKYKQLMEKCAEYKDKRFFMYFIKYILGRCHIFIFK